jgi:O-antigen/teichoic acid export membrane protein
MHRSAVREVSRGSFYLGLEQVTMLVGGVLYSIIVLRMLGPATYGILNLGQAAIGLAGVLTTNIETYLERFVGELDARGKGHLLRPLVRKILAVKAILALAAGGLVILLADWIASAYGYRDLRRLLPALAPLILLEAMTYAQRVVLFGLQRYRSIWLVSLGNNLLKLVIVFALWRLQEGVVALVVGIVLVQLVTAGGLVVLILRFLPASADPSDEVPGHRRIWEYVLPLFGARAFFLSGQHLNRLILGKLLSAHQLGIASFALMTIERFVGLAQAIPSSLLPTLSRLKGQNEHQSIEQVVTEGYRLVAACAFLLAAAVFALAREAVWITGGSEFLEAVAPLQILALTPLFRTMQQPLSMGFYTYERTRTVFWLAGLKFAVEPLAYPLLIPRLGVEGVAIANFLACIAVFGPSIRIADAMFPATAGARRAATARSWLLSLLVFAPIWLFRHVPDPWPGLGLRIGFLLVGYAIAFRWGGLVRPEDLRRFGEASRRPFVARTSAVLAGLMARPGRP